MIAPSTAANIRSAKLWNILPNATSPMITDASPITIAPRPILTSALP